MSNILMLDVSVGSGNLGDHIIMDCVRKELMPLFKNDFFISLPTHVTTFNWYQILRQSTQLKVYANCVHKFVCGSNLLVPDLMTNFPQWNINIFNYRPLMGSILVGVGAGAGAEKGSNLYTKYIYKHMLNREYIHSVRDERSKQYVEGLGLKAINTGCPTMWNLTPEFCSLIPKHKAPKVIFTLTNGARGTYNQTMIDCLIRNYDEVYFWPQGRNDALYLSTLNGASSVKLIPSTLESYHSFLTNNDTDYVGTRLHGGIYAMRHKRRSIIIAIDERARAINAKNNLNCIDQSEIGKLHSFINSSFETKIIMPFNEIKQWKEQF